MEMKPNQYVARIMAGNRIAIPKDLYKKYPDLYKKGQYIQVEEDGNGIRIIPVKIVPKL